MANKYPGYERGGLCKIYGSGICHGFCRREREGGERESNKLPRLLYFLGPNGGRGRNPLLRPS